MKKTLVIFGIEMVDVSHGDEVLRFASVMGCDIYAVCGPHIEDGPWMVSLPMGLGTGKCLHDAFAQATQDQHSRIKRTEREQ